MQRIILLGYMGAGKTTVGHALSKQTGLVFYDLDWYIETRMRKSVSRLFSELGEEGFRKLEHNMLHEVAEFENVIVSCGGGTPCYFDNMDYMNRQAITVYLKASPDVLFQHLKMARTPRPLLQGKTDNELKEYIVKHLQEREPHYQKAHHTVEVSLLDNHVSIRQTVEKIINLTTQ